MEGNQLVKLLSDSHAALSIIRNPVHHDRTKHVELDRHFITKKVTKQKFEMDYMPSKLQIADILTKALPQVAGCGVTWLLGKEEAGCCCLQ